MSDLPAGWEVFSLGEITEWSSGNTPSKVKPMFWNGNVPWISAVSMRGNYFFDSELKITNEAIEQGAKIAEPNTLLLLVRGSMLWNKIPIGITGCRVSFNQDVKCIAPKIKYTTAAFLLYWFLSCENHLMHMVTGTGIGAGKLDTTDLQKLAVQLPPLPEQRKIAEILSTWDKAIATTEKRIANSKQQKKALMQQLLTGKKRLAGFSGDWKVVKLGELLHERKDRNKDNKIQTVLSVTNHSGFVLPEEQFSKRVASNDVSNYKIVKRGEFGYNPSRINVGSFARLDDFESGILSPMYVVFSIVQEKLNSDYFLHWMSSNEARQRILGNTQGSVRDSVGFDALCSFPFRMPPLPEQQKIAQVLTTADKEISTLETQLSHLQQEKKALMQQLLTGKRRVVVEEG